MIVLNVKENCVHCGTEVRQEIVLGKEAEDISLLPEIEVLDLSGHWNQHGWRYDAMVKLICSSCRDIHEVEIPTAELRYYGIG